MPPYFLGSVSSHGGPGLDSLQGQGVPMPPPSVQKEDKETVSLSYDNTAHMNHITLDHDGQTKISALDDPTLVSELSPPDLPCEEEQARGSYEAKPQVWSSIGRKVCCNLLVMGGLIASVILLLQSFGETPANDTVVAAANSNATTNGSANQDFPTWAPYGNDNTDDFFNNDPSREPENGLPQGPDAAVNGNRPPPQGDGQGCQGRGDREEQGSSMMLRGSGGGGGGGGGCRGDGRCGCRGGRGGGGGGNRGNGGGGNRGNRGNGGGGGNRRLLRG